MSNILFTYKACLLEISHALIIKEGSNACGSLAGGKLPSLLNCRDQTGLGFKTRTPNFQFGGSFSGGV
jgi:hypothetical protein